MDFPLAPPVKDAVRRAIDLDDTGYANPEATEIAANLAGFAERRMGWSPDPEQVITCNDVVAGLTDLLRVLTTSRRSGDRHPARLPPVLHARPRGRVRGPRGAAGGRARPRPRRDRGRVRARRPRDGALQPAQPDRRRLRPRGARGARRSRRRARGLDPLRRDPRAADPPRRPSRPVRRRLRERGRPRHLARLGLEDVQPRRPRVRADRHGGRPGPDARPGRCRSRPATAATSARSRPRRPTLTATPGSTP